MLPAVPATIYLLPDTPLVTRGPPSRTSTSIAAVCALPGRVAEADLPFERSWFFQLHTGFVQANGAQTKSSEAGSWMPFAMSSARPLVGFQFNRFRALEQS